MRINVQSSTLNPCFYSFFMRNCLGLFMRVSATFAGLFQYGISKLYYL